MNPTKRALVLSGGGLFGAWQVGAWSALEGRYRPDVIIGSSIGSLNGWAIAGGCAPDELAERWRRAASQGKLQFRFPRRPFDGIVDPTQIESFIRDIHCSFRPRVEYYVVVTDLIRMRPLMVEAGAATWQHLAASCAVLGVLPQRRLNDSLLTDGGFLGALPLWAAVRAQAGYTLGLNVMPRMPLAIRAALRPFRLRCQFERPDPERTWVLSPSRALGTWRSACVWQQARIGEWISQGHHDAERFLDENNPLPECFAA